MIEVGEKYHMLTVKEILPKGRAIFTCDCGKEKEIRYYNVLREKSPTKSCGCLKKSNCRKMAEKMKGILTTPKGHSAITRIMKQYRTGAKSRGLKFELSREFVEKITKEPCIYCGTKESLITHTDYYSYKHNGIDRKNNVFGYTEDNCVPCCNFCNRAKFKYTDEYFIEMCKKVAEHNKEKDE